MNANRTKYASTPTYGMQKRGFMKKAPVRQAPETPDFSQVPQPAPTMPPSRRRGVVISALDARRPRVVRQRARPLRGRPVGRSPGSLRSRLRRFRAFSH